MEDVGDVLRGLKSKYKSVLLMADKRAHIQRAVEILGLVRGAVRHLFRFGQCEHVLPADRSPLNLDYPD